MHVIALEAKIIVSSEYVHTLVVDGCDVAVSGNLKVQLEVRIFSCALTNYLFDGGEQSFFPLGLITNQVLVSEDVAYDSRRELR